MTITMEEISKLREATSAGMMDCKKALEESKGDFDGAIEVLRKKGAATSAKRAERDAKEGLIVSYIHNNRIGTLLEFNCETDFVALNDDFKLLANDLAMHIAASAPEYISPSNVPAEIVAKEKEIELAQLKDAGKPEKVIDKILEGKIEKFYSRVCLMKQPFIKNPDVTVEDLINEKTAAIGEKISVRRFVRFELGK
ncbi:MAG: translation elongation factor Ts [bacterium]